MLLLIFAPQPQPAQPEFINLASVLGDVYPALNAAGSADLIFWSTDELYRFLDEAAQRLARKAGVFVTRDTSISTALDTGSYTLPAAQVATVQVDLAGKVLRSRSVQELEALDASWPASVGTPEAFAQDTQGVNHIVLYPAPDNASSGQTVGLVLHVTPSSISISNALLAAPTCLREYFSFYVLGEARSKESKAAMPEVGTYFRQLTGWMDQIIQSYWGEAQ